MEFDFVGFDYDFPKLHDDISFSFGDAEVLVVINVLCVDIEKLRVLRGLIRNFEGLTIPKLSEKGQAKGNKKPSENREEFAPAQSRETSFVFGSNQSDQMFRRERAKLHPFTPYSLSKIPQKNERKIRFCMNYFCSFSLLFRMFSNAYKPPFCFLPVESSEKSLLILPNSLFLRGL